MNKALFIIISLLLGGCSLRQCPNIPWKNELTFRTKVKITNGFYFGKTGVIVEQQRVYRGELLCNVPAFVISINSHLVDEVIVEQSDLEKINE